MNIIYKFALTAIGAAVATPSLATVIAGNLTGGSAMAGGGSFTIIAPPPMVGQDNFNDDNVRAFAEQQNFQLTSSLAVDSGGSIASGTSIDSYYVNFDPLKTETVSGMITFSSPILGIIYMRKNLSASDYLGSSTTDYRNPSLRGFESPDSVAYSGTQLTFDLMASSPGDSFRVITAAAGVPESATWAMMISGFGLVGAGMRRRTTRMIEAI